MVIVIGTVRTTRVVPPTLAKGKSAAGQSKLQVTRKAGERGLEGGTEGGKIFMGSARKATGPMCHEERIVCKSKAEDEAD